MITFQVVFHSINRNMMMSGSTDGLINVFDISQSTEDDSLLYTYNTMNSVQKLNWINEKKHAETISCITHTNDLQIWDMNSCLQTQNFERSDITKYSEVKIISCYMELSFSG